jgi:hypothetical protein
VKISRTGQDSEVVDTEHELIVSARQDQQASQHTTRSTKRKKAIHLIVSKRKKTTEAPNVTALADACSGPDAFYRLRRLVESWRNWTLPLMRVDHN